MSLFLNLFTLLKVIRNDKINCINYHQRIFLLYILIVKLFFRKIKIIYTGHNVFGDWINRFLIADQFIAISNVVKKDLITANNKNVKLIYHGIMIKKLANINLKENTSLNFGYVGRYTKIKGVMTLLRAFKLYHEKNPKNQLIIRGSGELLEEMKKYISNSELTESIIIMPHENDIEKIFDKIDILIFPSEYLEGFGLVIIEAMSRNIIVIKSHYQNEDEIFTDDYCFLFEPGNINNLLEKMEESVNNQKKREIILKNSKRLISQKFNINRFIQEYLYLLRDL